jgi:hypothetical protein
MTQFGVIRGGVQVGGQGAAGREPAAGGLVQRRAQLLDGEVGVFAHLQRGQFVQAQLAGPAGQVGGGLDLPGPFLAVGLQLEHPEQMAEHVPHGPAGAVGGARPVLGGQVVDEGEQPGDFGVG